MAHGPVWQAGGPLDGAHSEACAPGSAEVLQRGVKQSAPRQVLHVEKDTAIVFSMWRVESELDDSGAPYDRRAAVYDRLVRSRAYNRLAWSTSPEDYSRFAAAAVASAEGPLLEAAAGSAAATADVHARSRRPTTLVDLSRAMLERAARSLAAASGGDEAGAAARIRLVQADLFALPFPAHRFTTVMGLGLTHLFDDVAALVSALRGQLAVGGELHLAGLVAQTRRGRGYLEILHRAGEVAAPRTADELHVALGRPAAFRTSGCMAYATLPAAPQDPASP